MAVAFRYAHLPCLKAGPKKDRYLPMDVCTVIPCEKKQLTEEQTSNLIKSTARPAPERQQDIDEWVGFFCAKFRLSYRSRVWEANKTCQIGLKNNAGVRPGQRKGYFRPVSLPVSSDI